MLKNKNKSETYTFDIEHINTIINELQEVSNNIGVKSLDELYIPFNFIIEEMLCMQSYMVDALYEVKGGE